MMSSNKKYKFNVGSQPLSIWEAKVKNGHIKRASDQDIRSQVVEIVGTNVATTYIFCPQDPKVSLGVKLKFFVMVIKNLNKYFSFEITVLDNSHVRRRFRASNYQSTTRVRPFSCSMPMTLNPGWNQVQFNLGDITRRAYGTEYMETTRIQIHANCRIRRVYFADKLYTEDDVPPDYRLYVNDDPRTRRFSEPATAMTSAALTAAAMAGGYSKPIDCSGIVAAPPTPCGGDVIREEIPLPEEKMKSFIGAPAPVSTEILPNLPNQVTFSKDRLASVQAPVSVAGSKLPSVTSAGSKAPVVGNSGGQTPSTTNYPAPFSGSKAPSVTTASLIPMVGSDLPSAASKLPSVTSAGSKAPVVGYSGGLAPSSANSPAPFSTTASLIPVVRSGLPSDVNANAASKPPSVSSQPILAGQQASLAAAVSLVSSPAAPASAEKIASITDGEPPE